MKYIKLYVGWGIFSPIKSHVHERIFLQIQLHYNEALSIHNHLCQIINAILKGYEWIINHETSESL